MWMPQDLINHKSTSIQVMAWCHHSNTDHIGVQYSPCNSVSTLHLAHSWDTYYNVIRPTETSQDGIPCKISNTYPKEAWQYMMIRRNNSNLEKQICSAILIFFTCSAMNTGWWEIYIHSCYSLVKIAFAPICTCKNNRRTWHHNASTSHSLDVTDQLWWHHNPKSEKTILENNCEMCDPWLFLEELCVQDIK